MPQPRAPRDCRAVPERIGRTGVVLLTHNHFAFLQGLLDRPRGTAPSKTDLIRAAKPYAERYRGSRTSHQALWRAANSLNPAWVRWRRRGRTIVFRLTPRGRAILDGTVPAHVLGVGRVAPGIGRRRMS